MAGLLKLFRASLNRFLQSGIGQTSCEPLNLLQTNIVDCLVPRNDRIMETVNLLYSVIVNLC